MNTCDTLIQVGGSIDIIELYMQRIAFLCFHDVSREFV